MVDISAIAGTVSALKGAMDISKAMVGLRDGQVLQTKIIELNSKIIDAQSSALAANEERATLVENIRTLEKEITRLKEWDAGKDKYRLANLASGAFAYAPQPNADNTEPPHWLCVNCYDNRQQRSVLQYQGRTPSKQDSIYLCPACKGGFQVPYTRNPESVAKTERETLAKSEPAKPLRAPGEACPKCGEMEFRVDRSEPHPLLGKAGARIHHMKCTCGFTDERLITPQR